MEIKGPKIKDYIRKFKVETGKKVQLKKYDSGWVQNKTTAAHELATALIFTSGIIHYADKPEFFNTLPSEAVRILQDAPARWDETRCLVGEPGRVAIFARRSGNTWFIAGINGTDTPLPVVLDLSLFNGFRHRLVITEGADASMQVSAAPPPFSNQWKHDLPPRGGFILRAQRVFPTERSDDGDRSQFPD